MGVMRLEELAENQKLHIEVIAKTGRLEYDVVSKFSAHGAVFIEPIRYNNQIINFVRSDIIIKVLYTRNNRKPIERSNCYIKSVEYKGKQYHMIGSNNVGIEVNRRECFRIFIGEKGLAQVGEHTGIMKVTVKDISATGFSFLGDRESETPLGEDVRLTFQDSIRDIRFDLSGRLVRKVADEDEKTLYGCKLYISNKIVDSYIARRQREQAQHLQSQLIERSKATFEKLEADN